MGDNFEKSVVYGIISSVKEINKLEKDIDKLIFKVEENKLNHKEIVAELKNIRHKIWGMN